MVFLFLGEAAIGNFRLNGAGKEGTILAFVHRQLPLLQFFFCLSDS